MNRTYNPFERAYEDQARAIDATRMAREADPTCVGQRHGLYVFPLDGSGYDQYGGRFDNVGSCSSANYGEAECCGGYEAPAANLTSSGLPGCRCHGNYPARAGPSGGPGDPFEVMMMMMMLVLPLLDDDAYAAAACAAAHAHADSLSSGASSALQQSLTRKRCAV